MMSYDKGKKVVFVIVAVLFFAALASGIVMMLWNWLMPEILGLSTITIWQSLGILALSKILFGDFTHKKRCSHCHTGSKWKNISSTDKQSLKEKFMQKWADCYSEGTHSETTQPEK